MRTNIGFAIALVMICTLLLVACETPKPTAAPVSPLTSSSPLMSANPTPSGPITQSLQVTPSPSKSAIVGQVFSLPGNNKPLPNTVVRLARVIWNEQKTDGAFVLEGATSPSTITDKDGHFAFKDIEPADYVIVIGDVQGSHVIISESNGKAKVYSAGKDKVLDLGTLSVQLNP